MLFGPDREDVPAIPRAISWRIHIYIPPLGAGVFLVDKRTSLAGWVQDFFDIPGTVCLGSESGRWSVRMLPVDEDEIPIIVEKEVAGLDVPVMRVSDAVRVLDCFDHLQTPLLLRLEWEASVLLQRFLEAGTHIAVGHVAVQTPADYSVLA